MAKSWLSMQLKGRGITKDELAVALGVSRPTLKKYETDFRSLTITQVAMLERMGFIVPTLDGLVAIVCPTCGGHGRIYRDKMTTGIDEGEEK